MDAASLGLGGVHREVGVLDQLVELGAVFGRDRDADAGVGRKMVAEALIGLAYRLVNAGHEFLDLGAAADRGLDHRKFVAAETGDEIARLGAILEAGRDRLQKFIADVVSERVVDAFEFVDVDIEQCELLAANGLAQLALDLLAEQHPVRKVGQRVVMRQMRDLLVGKPALGHVVDDVDDVARLTRRIADSEPLGGDVARAHPLGFPDVLVLEQAVGRLQRFLLVGRDEFGGGLWKEIKGRLADDQVA